MLKTIKELEKEIKWIKGELWGIRIILILIIGNVALVWFYG